MSHRTADQPAVVTVSVEGSTRTYKAKPYPAAYRQAKAFADRTRRDGGAMLSLKTATGRRWFGFDPANRFITISIDLIGRTDTDRLEKDNEWPLRR